MKSTNNSFERSVKDHLYVDTRFRESKYQEHLITAILIINLLATIVVGVIGYHFTNPNAVIGSLLYLVVSSFILLKLLRTEKIFQHQREKNMRNLLSTSCLSGEKINYE